MATSELAGKTILIIDDEIDNVNVAEAMLKLFGAKVHAARNGALGLETMAQITPDVILCDLSMPQMDGWEVIQHIRQTADLQNFKVIAFTAHAMYGDRDRALKAGFDGYLTKPIKVNTLLEEVRRFI